MTPPLCYADPGCHSSTNPSIVTSLCSSSFSLCQKHTYKTLVYPVMCDTSTCHSVYLMCWGNAGHYYSRPVQTFMQRRSYQPSLPPSPLLGKALRASLFVCHAVPGYVQTGFEILRRFRSRSPSALMRKNCCPQKKIDRKLPSAQTTLRRRVLGITVISKRNVFSWKSFKQLVFVRGPHAYVIIALVAGS